MLLRQDALWDTDRRDSLDSVGDPPALRPPHVHVLQISKGGDTLSSRHVSSCDVTRAVGI